MIYAIGDVQGCFDQLQHLLALIEFQPSKDELWLVGDLVCRGSKSLEVLRFLKKLFDQGAARVVLGNHDLHLLAVIEGVRKTTAEDRLSEVLKAQDRDLLASWLRTQPLLYENDTHVMVHAGIWPAWSLEQARQQAENCQAYLQKPGSLLTLFHSHPRHFSEANTELDRHIFAVNSFTRMRFVKADGALDFERKDGDLTHSKPGEILYPWFQWPGRIPCDKTILFGHWAALSGETGLSNIIGLDTGCVWGRRLTALRLSDAQQFSCPFHFERL